MIVYNRPEEVWGQPRPNRGGPADPRIPCGHAGHLTNPVQLPASDYPLDASDHKMPNDPDAREAWLRRVTGHEGGTGPGPGIARGAGHHRGVRPPCGLGGQCTSSWKGRTLRVLREPGGVGCREGLI